MFWVMPDITIQAKTTLTAQPFDPVDCVDPFIGVDGGGSVLPGALVPFGMASLSPDTIAPQDTSGYNSHKPIIGFSHNHTSGTGGAGRYGNLLVMPQTGMFSLAMLTNGATIKDEAASPGYYSATFADSGMKAELTVSARSGVHRYTFPDGGRARILFDVSATRNTGEPNYQSPNPDKTKTSRCTAAEARIISDHGFEGEASCKGGWGGKSPYTIYFAAEFDHRFAAYGGWQNDLQMAGTNFVNGTQSGLYAEFDVKAGESVGLQVGISYLSLENARKNLARTHGKTFDQVRTEAEATWRDYLNRIQVEGGTATERTIFYTALYHTAFMPTDVTGDAPGFPADQSQFWNFYCLWDTYHTINPLYTLIAPDRESAIVNFLVAICQKNGWLPDAWTAGDYGSIQGGTHADTVIADAFIKGLGGFDRKKAYEAIRNNATQPAPPLAAGDAQWGNIKKGRFGDYFTLGYLPIENPLGANQESCPVSRTLEYSVNDYSVATVARILGKTADADFFTKQSLNGWKLWNPATKFFWAKDRQGQFVDGFKPNLRLKSWLGPFYEGTPYQYAFSMRHDVQGLINRLGGKAAFLAFLDKYFDGGFHDQGNEPVILNPWLYNYVDRPDKTVDRVREEMVLNYKAVRVGLPGNDDAGTMSAWYVWAAMGFYPVTGQDVYLLASPIFSKVTLQLGGGKTFSIRAENLSSENKYVQSAKLNGKAWNQAWLRHADLIDGGTLELEMTATPSDWDGKNRPPSLSSPN